VGEANIGSRVFFVFMAINFVCIPIIYLFYPETKNRTLEDMEVLFNKNATESLASLTGPEPNTDKQLEADTREV
jgi:Sugar (and other) transporter